MKLFIKIKGWAVRIGFLVLGLLGALLGGFLWGRQSGNEDKREEETSADDYQSQQNEFERITQIKRESREEILSLSDTDFDERYPSVPRDAKQGGNRYLDRCRAYLQSRRGGRDSGSPDDHSPGGD
ncbi:hypothetical protein [Oceanispirochaeta sp.]|uniref:hypothetical protein n=1 Tax=Oceanispirochaeta sp. TaxID=2035350 RepID=UPI002631FA30|nr:hypothetical protein [Oceanispirochaeta sp.]MDA3958940.1 hypothetical protein [Oceanispirochaeta sp.]